MAITMAIKEIQVQRFEKFTDSWSPGCYKRCTGSEEQIEFARDNGHLFGDFSEHFLIVQDEKGDEALFVLTDEAEALAVNGAGFEARRQFWDDQEKTFTETDFHIGRRFEQYFFAGVTNSERQSCRRPGEE